MHTIALYICLYNDSVTVKLIFLLNLKFILTQLTICIDYALTELLKENLSVQHVQLLMIYKSSVLHSRVNLYDGNNKNSEFTSQDQIIRF